VPSGKSCAADSPAARPGPDVQYRFPFLWQAFEWAEQMRVAACVPLSNWVPGLIHTGGRLNEWEGSSSEDRATRPSPIHTTDCALPFLCLPIKGEAYPASGLTAKPLYMYEANLGPFL
jgi:hypothetical protein